jgi:hypothetical protein
MEPLHTNKEEQHGQLKPQRQIKRTHNTIKSYQVSDRREMAKTPAWDEFGAVKCKA